MTDQLLTLFDRHPVEVAITAGSAVVLALLVTLAVRRLWRAARRRKLSAEHLGTLITAGIASGVAAQGMWIFFDDTVGLPIALRVVTFAFIELMVITSAIRARSSMRDGHGAGVDGVAMWVLTCLSAVLSATHAASFGEALLRLCAPLVAAWGWERGMALERRRRTGRRAGLNWRLTPERIMVRLGLADPTDRTASEVDADRRLTRLAVAAKRARAVSGRGRGRALRRLDRAMEGAVEHGALGTDPAARERLMARMGALVNSADLLTIRPPAPWDPPAPADVNNDTAGQPMREQLPAATAGIEPAQVSGPKTVIDTPSDDEGPGPDDDGPSGGRESHREDPIRLPSIAALRLDLAALPSDAARVRAALADLGMDAAPAQVREWLTAHGATVSDHAIKSAVRRARAAQRDRETPRAPVVTLVPTPK